MKKIFTRALLALALCGMAHSADIASTTTATETLSVETHRRIVEMRLTRDQVVATYARFTVLPSGTEHRIGSFSVIRERAAVLDETVVHGAQNVSLATTQAVLIKFADKWRTEDGL